MASLLHVFQTPRPKRRHDTEMDCTTRIVPDICSSLWADRRRTWQTCHRTAPSLRRLNKDHNRALQAAVYLGQGAAVASAFHPLWLTGSSLDAPSGQLLGGSVVAADGSWQATSLAPVPTDAGSVSVLLPPATAVLLRAL